MRVAAGRLRVWGKSPRLLWLLAALATLSAACDARLTSDFADECSEATALLLTASDRDVLILDGSARPLTLNVSGVKFAADGVSEAVALPRYFVDVSGDGEFEIAATATTIMIELTQSREYPIQVTAQSCQNGVLLARQLVQATVVSRPSLSVELSPTAGQPVRVNTTIAATLTLSAGANSPPLILQWDWGDGVSQSIEVQQAFAQLTVEKAYDSPGVKQFAVRAVDVYGQVVTSVSFIISTLPTVETFSLDFGGQIAGFDVYTPWLAAQPGTHVAIASGPSGLVLARVVGSGPELASRFNPAFPQSANLRGVWINQDQQVAYAAAGEAGLYLIDVSSAASPRLLPPGQIVPAGNYTNVTRAWICDDRTYFFNEGDAIYGIELTSASLLANQRAGLDWDRFAWDYIRAITGNAEAPVLKLAHPEAVDLACPNGGLLVVGDRQTLTVYNLEPFFGPAQAPAVVAEFAIDVTPYEANLALQALAAATSPPAATFTVALALGGNGNAEYVLQPTGETYRPQLRRHRQTLRDNSIYSPDQFIAESHIDALIDGDQALYWVNGLQSADAYLAFAVDNSAASGAISQTTLYSGGNICSPATAPFYDIEACAVGVAVENVVTRAAGFEFWGRRQGGIQRLRRAGAQVKTYALPLLTNAILLSADHYWVFGGEQLLRFDRLQVEATAPTALQAGPLDVTSVGIAVSYTLPGSISHEVLLVGDGSLAWLDTTTRQTLASVSLGHGIYAAAFDTQRSLAAVVDAEANRLRLWRRDGANTEPGLVSSQTGFWGAAGCAGQILAWEGGLEGMRLWRVNSAGDGLAKIADWPFRPYIAAACDAGRLYAATAAFGEFVELSVYNLNNMQLLSRQEIPAVINQDVSAIEIRADDGWLGLQIRGRGAYFFNIADGDLPQLVAADYFEKVANGFGFALSAVGAGLRYGVLTYEPDAAPPKLLIKRTPP